MRYIFIVNPKSAKGEAMKIATNIGKVCKRENLPYEIYYTAGPGDATKIALNYKNEENIIYSVGGDGTLSEVLNGIIGTKNKLGIIPAGSGNDFYRSLKEIGQAEFKADVGVINNKYFLNVSCVGIDAEVANNIPLMKQKNIPVKQLYNASIVYTFATYKFRKIEFKSDTEKYMGTFTILSICNGRYYGGGYPIAPKASLEDGVFEVYYAERIPKIIIPKILLKLKKGKHEEDKRVKHFKTKELEVTSQKPIRFNVDGETLTGTNFKIKILPRAINIYYNASLEQEFLNRKK